MVTEDEILIKNIKSILLFFSASSLCVTAYNAGKIEILFFSVLTFYISNIFTFYSMETDIEKCKIRRNKLLVIYKYVIIAIGTIFILSMGFNKHKVFVFILLILFKLIIFITAFFAPIYSIKDDKDMKPKETKEVRRKVKKEIKSSKEQEMYKTSITKGQENKKTRQFVEEHEKKQRVSNE